MPFRSHPLGGRDGDCAPSPPSAFFSKMMPGGGGGGRGGGGALKRRKGGGNAPPGTGRMQIQNDPLHAIRRRIAVLRIAFVASLLATAAVCGYVSFALVNNLEQDIGFRTYESVAASALAQAQAITVRKAKGGRVMSSIYSNQFPNADEGWPFVALDGYMETSKEVAEQSGTMTLALNTLLRPDQMAAFEAFANRTYRQQGYPETAGVSEEFGFGIYAFDENKTRVHSTAENHDTPRLKPWGPSKYDVVVPIFQHNNPNATSMLFDVTSSEIQGRVVDSMLDCSRDAYERAMKLQRQEREQREGPSPSNVTTSQLPEPSCSVVTDIIELIVKPGPAALMYQPIYPRNDPYTMTGIMGTTLHWEEVLNNTVPTYISGLVCVIGTDSQTEYSYVIQRGSPVLLGQGDYHDPRYSAYGKTVSLTDVFGSSTIASAKYTLTIYPSEEVFQRFSTNAPMAVSLGFAGVICFCAFVFFVYDWFVKNESQQRKAILEVKRRYVRFISHEVRTPLNTVSMGLEVLREDMWACRDTVAKQIASASLLLKQEERGPNEPPPPQSESSQALGSTPPMTSNTSTAIVPGTGTSTMDESTCNQNRVLMLQQMQNQMNEWVELTTDIVENSNAAVLVLNDLLNYDKIESGALQLSTEYIDMCSLTRGVTSNMQLEARNRNVHLTFQFRNRCLQLASATATTTTKAGAGDNTCDHTKNCRCSSCSSHGSSGGGDRCCDDDDDEDDENKNNNSDSFLIDTDDLEAGMYRPRQPNEDHENDRSTTTGEEDPEGHYDDERVYEDHGYRALADEHRIRQVIRNIISNALKFTPDDGRVSVVLQYEPLRATSGNRRKKAKNADPPPATAAAVGAGTPPAAPASAPSPSSSSSSYRGPLAAVAKALSTATKRIKPSTTRKGGHSTKNNKHSGHHNGRSTSFTASNMNTTSNAAAAAATGSSTSTSASGGGGAAAPTTARGAPSHAGTIRLSVKDTGIGMTEEQLGCLFGEGVQFDASKLQAGGGSGLGLWISKGIVESHGGTITCTSEGHQRGCVFTIELPLYRIATATAVSASKTKSSAGTAPGPQETAGTASCSDTVTEPSTVAVQGDHSSKSNASDSMLHPGNDDTGIMTKETVPRCHRVLVVDDAVSNRKMLLRLLERNGHSAVGVGDGLEAIDAISADLQQRKNMNKKENNVVDDETDCSDATTAPFDTILMDYEMPRLNGPEASEQIRKLGYNGNIYGVTGNVLREDIDYFKQLGADEVLSKPVRYHDIQNLWGE